MEHDGIGGEMMRALSEEIDSLCLVNECRELEEGFGKSYTDGILWGEEGVSLREMRDEIRSADRDLLLERCVGKSRLVCRSGRGGGMGETLGWCGGFGA